MNAVSARSAITSPSITRSPTYCSGSPFWRVRSAAAGECAVGVGQLHLPAAQVMPLGPGLAVGRSARADGVQDGDEAVGVRVRSGRGRFLDRARGRGVRCGHGGLRACRRTPSPIKVAGRAWLENRATRKKPAGTRPPRPARRSRQTECQPAPRKVMPAGKCKQHPNSSGFRGPATCFRWRYQSCLT